MIIFITIVETDFCTLDVSQTASYEITPVCPSVCLSFHPSVTKFSQDWIISFFLILYMMITYHGFSWLAKPDFWKKKKKNGSQNLGPKWVFCNFIEFGSYIFLEIAYSDSLQPFLTSTWGKTYDKNFSLKLGTKLNFLPFSQVWFICFPLNCTGW